MILQDIPNPVVFSAFKHKKHEDGDDFYTGDYINNYDGFNTNYGNSFSLASGIFTSPRKGVFEFSAAIYHHHPGNNQLMVEKNNSENSIALNNSGENNGKIIYYTTNTLFLIHDQLHSL